MEVIVIQLLNNLQKLNEKSYNFYYNAKLDSNN